MANIHILGLPHQIGQHLLAASLSLSLFQREHFPPVLPISRAKLSPDKVFSSPIQVPNPILHGLKHSIYCALCKNRFISSIIRVLNWSSMESELCSSHVLSPSSRDIQSGDEELSVLPRDTKVIVKGNNRTKSVLVGLQGVVKKAVGLGGWHWLVLKNGVEVKLQRNALSVLEAPTGKNDIDDMDCDNSCSSFDVAEKDAGYSSIEYQRPTRPRVKRTRPWVSSAKSSNRSYHREVHMDMHSRDFKPKLRVNLAKLGTPTLWRYWNHFNLVSVNPNPTTEQLFHGVQHHFRSQMQLDEVQVIVSFVRNAKRLKPRYRY
ncbi:histone deacetylase complex subunit [Rhynchospora pubera]|uniref:Histone deacetylase complex subunit n=1 Tax=Rhynchospora pubera TaxID=906938 RepID=A0AAV8GBZ1_9POAL|nr:histone deacetylase complex subunit [Rhynchospora pubera]